MFTEYALTKLNKTRQLNAGKLEKISMMLDAREALLLKYCTLLDPIVEGTQQEYPPKDKISDFCQTLIDYTSRGHFDIYPRIVQIMETMSGKRLTIAKKIIPKILNNTEQILCFDDKYGNEADRPTSEDLNEIKADLGKIGQILETRFTLEDRLVVVLQMMDDLMQVSTPQEKKK
jgi:regulator of sigma D